MSAAAQLFDRAFQPLAAAVSAKRIPGGVLGIVDKSGSRIIRSIGSAQLAPKPRPMQDNTWFDLASLTKVIFTTPRILALGEDGVIDLDAPLVSALPDLRQYDAEAWERKVTFRQCLGHQTPFPAVEPIYTYGRDPELLRAFILQREWRARDPVYSDINFILLGFALERLSSKTIHDMDPGPGFAWSTEPDVAAATEDCTWRHRVLSGKVHDDNCSALQGAGHAGLFGTAASVLDFAQGLLTGTGASEGSIALMRAPLSATRTHGWERPYEGWSGGTLCSPGTIGHTGFTGTGLWIDFDKGKAWTLLTNRIHPTRHFDSGIVQLRQAVGDLMNGAQ
ncbi:MULTISPECIES: serine hydrolase [unclassified Mesorhizobium]|uniref:serine hydrolase domain-containing protein n=1 Tax=unclassified Mesorhizobium TaxID=325217 RepID=UPI000F755410|nr:MULTISPECIES: serine hydrolase [unclassified Mesorhizobium]AZO42117.1 class C beta-lactamase-related serine hydrolase [Mesorhizobium sp. M7D.F.Ca.US.005.01.1.1]RUX95026.1 class C beta-lactamase-related serine hydrolase [Mesorhizobium sp. M7D.F.Ca.US.004.01.2.1]RVA28473.1 class C beta-lactamase-related serine hydrolase [Mesorhizobium sp. M7D.F.Ca.US.004.03.1.1]